MIIYAYYGMGKTTFVGNHKEIAIDIDNQYFSRVNYPMNYRSAVYDEINAQKMIFINSDEGAIDENDIDIAFIPSNMKMVERRLRERGTDVEFIYDMMQEAEAIMKMLHIRFPNAIELKDDEYISDYEELLLSRYHKLHP